jgi:gliding motility-associated-like protein
MKHLLTILAIVFIGLSSQASHIMGGYISVQHQSGNTYTLKVVIWRDCINGQVAMPTSASVEMRDNVTNTLVQTFSVPRISLGNVTLGDACYTPTGLCVEEGIFVSTVTLNDNPNGYYLTWDDCCRNNIIDNLSAPTSLGMTFVCEFPDPAFENSTPDFGLYPADGYFCASYTKYIDVSMVDPDGDSLVYSLETPLDQDAIKPFTDCGWQAPYSLANIVGGTPPMSIDPVTGIIQASPTIVGLVHVFSVKVEEWRDTTVAQNGPKVKIGEVRRDVQYMVLNCSQDLPPNILAFQDTVVSIQAGVMNCFDVIAQDPDAQDTIYIELLSPTFSDTSSAAFFQQSTPTGINQHPYGFWNGTTMLPDTLILPQMGVQGNLFFSEGTVGMQYCWQPECIHISTDTLYPLYVESYSLGCSGSDTAQAIIWAQVTPPPDAIPQFIMQADDNRWDFALNQLCFDVIVHDADNGDQVFLNYYSPAFAEGAVMTYNAGTYGYYNDTTQVIDYIATTASTSINPALITNTQTIGARLCWDLECDNLTPIYPLNLAAYSIGYCGDTAYASKVINIDVDTIPNELINIPNIFTPDNGDVLNNTFKIDGYHEPCFDFMSVKIYNRWGRLVFESDLPYFQWDGKINGKEDASEGTYFVVMEGQYAGEVVSKQYTVSLIRGR